MANKNKISKKDEPKALIIQLYVSQRRKELLAYHKFLQEELNLDLNEIWVDEYLKVNNPLQSELLPKNKLI